MYDFLRTSCSSMSSAADRQRIAPLGWAVSSGTGCCRTRSMVLLDRQLVEGNVSTLGKHPISNKHIFTKLVVQVH